MPTVPIRSLFFFIFLLTAAPSPSHSFSSYFHYRNVFSLSHSLVTRVADLRAERGDVAGSDRARAIADKLERGLGFGFWRLMWSAGWDYAWSCGWRDLPGKELYGAVFDMNELLRVLTELTRIESVAERSAWVARNYQNVLTISKSLSRKLLKAFHHSRVLREVLETLQIEVVEGGLLRDCLELGSNDLKALIQILKDLALRFFPVSDSHTDL